MKAVVQRVENASVLVDGVTVGAIEHGLLVYLGVGRNDTDSDLTWLVDKIAGLRIFSDDEGKMSRSVQDTSGSILVVSQFTLYGDVKKGKRPNFTGAMPPERAEEMYEDFCRRLENLAIPVAKGRFRADMKVHSINDGPVTILLDTERSQTVSSSPSAPPQGFHDDPAASQSSRFSNWSNQASVAHPGRLSCSRQTMSF
jgi:D-tyrosyl-tRNA(Tyr) deacylase